MGIRVKISFCIGSSYLEQVQNWNNADIIYSRISSISTKVFHPETTHHQSIFGILPIFLSTASRNIVIVNHYCAIVEIV